MKRETLLLLFSRCSETQKKEFYTNINLAKKGKSLLFHFSERGRIAPYYLPADWEGFEEHIADSTDFEGFSSFPALLKTGMGNANWKNIAIGGGIGGIAGLTYGYWDWQDEKRQAEFKGLEKPDKKKILIRDTLVGLGLGATAGAFADKLLKILEDKKATKEQKLLFDNIEKEILKGQDKNKIRKYLQLHSKDLTTEQYKYLSEFANSMTDRDAIQSLRDKKLQAIQDRRIANERLYRKAQQAEERAYREAAKKEEREYRESQKPSKFEQIKEQILRLKNRQAGSALIDSVPKKDLTTKQRKILETINSYMPFYEKNDGKNGIKTSRQVQLEFLTPEERERRDKWYK